ncbi:MAG: DUF4783 domain-containing protein [Rhodobacter sp.]|nr:DUF4783 domain-containing protein [Rhodobacter sp.]
MFLLTLAVAVPAVAGDVRAIFGQLSTGRAAPVASYFDDHVLMAVDQVEEMLSESYATNILQQFLDRGSNWRFTQIHSGHSVDGGRSFILGSLTGSTGSFRVYVLYRGGANAPVIQQLTVERE